VHKSAETFAIGVKLVNTSISSRKWVWLMLTYSAITPFGIIVGMKLLTNGAETMQCKRRSRLTVRATCSRPTQAS
jgi:hypothetical protein